MQHNKTFLKLFFTACVPAILLVAAFIHFTSCSKPKPRFCVCTEIEDRSVEYNHPEATTNEACKIVKNTIHRNQDVYCIIK